MNSEEVNERTAQGLYAYRWSVNISINPYHWLEIIIWRRETRYLWSVRQPLNLAIAREVF